MNALLNTIDPNNRLIEALGSAALFSDTTSASSPLGLPLNVLDLGSVADTTVDAAHPGAAGQTTSLPDITSLLGAANGDSPLTGGLPLDSLLGGGLPLIGNGGTGDVLSVLDLDNILGDIGGGTPGASTSPLDLAGEGTTLQPIFNAVNSLIKDDIHYKLEALSDLTGTANTVHAITALGETIGLGEIGIVPSADGSSNLITDTLNLPGDILAGNINGAISNIGLDLTETLQATSNVLNNVLFGGTFPQFGNDPANPLPEIIASIGNTVSTLPLLSLGNGGLLGGLVGNLSGSSSGHLIDVDAGPQQSNGFVFDLLSAPGGDPGHTASVNAVDVGPNGPQLLDLSLLTGAGGLPLPGLGGGADGLTGNVLGDHGLLGGNLLGGITGGATSLASVTTIVADVTEILPIAGGLDHGPLNQVGTHLI